MKKRKILKNIKDFFGFYNLDQFLNDSGNSYSEEFIDMSDDEIKKRLDDEFHKRKKNVSKSTNNGETE